MRFFFLYIILFTLFGVMAVGQALYHEDNTQDIFNITNGINWDDLNDDLENLTQQNLTMNMSVAETNMARLMNVFVITIDTLGYIATETVKFGVEAGYRNPNYNYLFWTKVLWVLALLTILSTLWIVIPYFLVILFVIGQWIYNKYKQRRGVE